jgi:hypothetical protein
MSDSSMSRRGDTIENPHTGDRITSLETARDTDGKLLRMDYVAPPRSKGPSTSTCYRRSASRWYRAC